MNSPLSSQSSASAIRLAGMARLIRRICLLREQGDAVAAARLEETEFANAVRDIRLAEGPEAVPESELKAMYVNEARRVADALVLAELIVPLLAGSIPAGNGAAPRPVQTGGREEPIPFSKTADPFASSPAIPDLLDAMLAADGAARRHASGRRAN